MPTTPVRAVLVALSLLLLTACAGSVAPGVAAPPTTPAPTEDQPDVTGTFAGRLVERGPGLVVVDLVDVLSGEEAVEAAHADGVLPTSETSLPNDVYVRESDTRAQFDVAVDATTRLYDCTTGCELVEVETAAFLAGAVTPFNGPSAVLELTVDGADVVTAIAEIYLP